MLLKHYKHRRRRDHNLPEKAGLYWLPNVLTMAALFSAFYSIIASLKEQYEIAALSIFAAMIFDALDGRIARIMHSESDFGAQYDSLADMVSFGVAPALVIYNWSLYSLGKFGWLISFSYVACTALRLARFNTKLGSASASKRYSQGLPCTSAGAVIASIVWVGNNYGFVGSKLSIYVAIISVMVSLFMVSSIKYYVFKDIELKGKLPYIFGLINVLFFITVAIEPPIVLLVFFLLYILSGPIITLFQLRSNNEVTNVEKSPEKH